MKVLVNARYYGAPFHQAKFRYLLEQLIQLTDTLPVAGILMITDIPNAEFLVSDVKNQSHCDFKLEQVRKAGMWFGPLFIWYDLMLNRVAKKYQADLIIHGDHFCALTINIPQVMMGDGILRTYVNQLSVTDRLVLQNRWPKMISKANGILFWSPEILKNFIKGLPKWESRCYMGEMKPLHSIRSISWEEKQEKLQQYSLGTEFFIGIADGPNALNVFMDLLKGYSWFKKRYQSNMKLLMFGVLEAKWLESIPLDSYKYRDDVILCRSDDYMKVLPAGYAMIYLPHGSHMPLAILEAMQSGVPVIASTDPVTYSIFGDNIAWKNESDPEQWGHLMGELYKNEGFRRDLMNRGFSYRDGQHAESEQNSLSELIKMLSIG